MDKFGGKMANALITMDHTHKVLIWCPPGSM